jgi:hypothetical protein
MKARLTNSLPTLILVGSTWALLSGPLFANDNDSILKKRNTIDTISSTVPANGMSIRMDWCAYRGPLGICGKGTT